MGSPDYANLILEANGAARTFMLTDEGVDITSVLDGRWSSTGDTLTIEWETGGRGEAPFLFLNGQLVWPSTAGQVQVWQRAR